MKKLFFVAIIAIFGSLSVNAQGQFNAGISGGIPIGDAGDFSTFAIAVDLGYLFEISDDFDAGGTIGYSHSFGEEQTFGSITIEAQDVQFLPIAGSARFEVAPSFTLGADLGYALGINDGNDGGFYYSPRAQYSVSEAIDIVAAYRGVSRDGGSWNIVSLGIMFGL
ncbi:hypothetical protein [Hyunsoonleella pacifica]|uniref:Outer membrane protein beta-barrel domain-containing protein n=1 Tax=Hyunsoonleella pacifica TaxID=1080224 RepID=A0A4Q9FRW4_9FLAO|nr:hypothetical protein [Hyunsoonleella pacifica]TBN17867.1 hypothetical protein EYD46_06020 [Hyunsoonleella pacifica]GGD08209.1 hypothetical protein GCM10011368_07750 [Hyunsoonleella pacifica]